MGAKYRSDELLGRDGFIYSFGIQFTFECSMAAQQQPSEEDILAFLRGQDVPLSGKLVGQRMGFQGRRNVNAQLHSLLRQKLVRKDEKKNPPEWSAVGGAADRGTPPPQPSRVSALAQDFEGIDLSGDSSDPPSTAASSTQSINTPVGMLCIH